MFYDEEYIDEKIEELKEMIEQDTFKKDKANNFISFDELEDEYSHNEIEEAQHMFMEKAKKYLSANYPGQFAIFCDFCVHITTVAFYRKSIWENNNYREEYKKAREARDIISITNDLVSYNINYIFCDGNYNLCINTNYIIKAENEDIAMKEASKIEEEISKYIMVYYYTGKRDIVVSVLENPYFNKAFIEKYICFNQTKTKKDFITSLEYDYDGYFSANHSKLIFEPISYGVSNKK